MLKTCEWKNGPKFELKFRTINSIFGEQRGGMIVFLKNLSVVRMRQAHNNQVDLEKLMELVNLIGNNRNFEGSSSIDNSSQKCHFTMCREIGS